MVKERGFLLEREEVARTVEGMEDGGWEVGYVLRKREKVVRRLREQGVGEKEVGSVEAWFDAVAAGVEGLEGGLEGVRCMDYWVGRWGVEC